MGMGMVHVAATEPTGTVRTYGNFRRPESPGIGTLGTIGTLGVFGGLIVLIILMTLRLLIPAVIWTLLVLAVLASLAIKDQHGRSGMERMAAKVTWRATRRRGRNVYRSGPLGRTRWGTFQLPGLLAPTTLHESEDSYGRRFALLEMSAVGHYSVVIGCEPDGASLVDPEQVDTWVAQWGQWLNALGQETGIVGASVTVETAPDTGARLRRAVNGRMSSRSPSLAQEVLHQLIEEYPSGSAQVRAWVSLTFNGRTYSGHKRTLEEVARDIASRLPSLTQGLVDTGAGYVRPLEAPELCEIVRVAYDPPSAALIDEVHSSGHVPDLSWDDVGPAAAEAQWDSYVHDAAVSKTWLMSTAPRGEVFSSVMTRLLAPHPDVDRKRVTIIYRPLDTAKAARIVEQDKRNADFRVNAAQRPSARALSAARSAGATATEEARGAGLVDFGLLVTATVSSIDRLPDARAAIDNLTASARLGMRPAYGAQDSAFAACLPLGLVLQAHMRIPAELRSAL